MHRSMEIEKQVVELKEMASRSESPLWNRSELIREEPEREEDDPMMAVQWYHPHLTRHAADCMLIDNAPEGSYLLRPSQDGGGPYAISIKLSSSVQHVRVTLTTDGGYRFGNSTFHSVESFRKHFEVEKPVIGGDSGITVILKFPYTRFVHENHMYTDIVHHAVTNMLESESDSEDNFLDHASNSELSYTHEQQRMHMTIAVSSREGYLTKLGRIRKNWKVRWFVLRNQSLSYYKAKQYQKPIRILDMSSAKAVEYDDSKHKDYSFRIELPHRTYFLYGNSAEDCQQWVDLLRSKLVNQ